MIGNHSLLIVDGPSFEFEANTICSASTRPELSLTEASFGSAAALMFWTEPGTEAK